MVCQINNTAAWEKASKLAGYHNLYNRLIIFVIVVFAIPL